MLALIAVAGVAGAVVLARAWPAVQVVGDAQALARLKLAPLGEHLTSVQVSDESGRRIPVSVRSGRLWPQVTLAQGSASR